MHTELILQRDEIEKVLKRLHKNAKRRISTRQNLAIFRLSCCCGLRCMEIAGLNLGDVVTNIPKPFIRIRKDNTKGRDGQRKARIVPMWWDAGTCEDLKRWKDFRLSQTQDPNAPFICAVNAGESAHRLTESSIARRWRTAISVLGPERVALVSIHKGRHSFCSHALHGGRTLAEVRDAVGHSSIDTTSIYLHALDRQGLKDLFAFGED